MSHSREKEFLEHLTNPSFGQSPLESELELNNPASGSDEYIELGELILRVQDKDIRKKDFLRLENQLLADPRAVRYYIEFTLICAGLRILLGKKDFAGAIKPLSTVKS